MKNNNFDDFEEPLTDRGHDGVIYEPSNAAKRKSAQRDSYNSSKMHSKPNKKPQKKQPPKSNYKILMVITIITGIIIFIVATYLVYNSFLEPQPANPNLSPNDLNILDKDSIESPLDISKNNTEHLGVITDLFQNSKQIALLSLSDNKTYSLKISGSTQLKDKYAQPMTFSQLNKGDIVEFAFDSDRTISTLSLSNEGWEYPSVKNVSVNTSTETITFNENTYSYNDLTYATYKNTDFNLEDIDALDVMTIRGYRNAAYSINIEKSHGIIQISNKDKIKNGTIEVDKEIYKNLSETGSVKVSEGNHRIVITGDNCTPYTEDITIKNNETYELDLSNVQIKSGLLLIKANVSDYLLSVNDVPEFSREPLNLEYGAYTIKIEKEGYNSYETQIVIDKDQVNLNAELKKDVKLAKITITSSPDNAEVYIDNAKIGYTPVTAQVVEGKHNLTVKKDGYKDTNFTNISIEGEDNNYNVILREIDPPAETITQPQQSNDSQISELD